jgi:hypothetical protein
VQGLLDEINAQREAARPPSPSAAAEFRRQLSRRWSPHSPRLTWSNVGGPQAAGIAAAELAGRDERVRGVDLPAVSMAGEHEVEVIGLGPRKLVRERKEKRKRGPREQGPGVRSGLFKHGLRCRQSGFHPRRTRIARLPRS